MNPSLYISLFGLKVHSFHFFGGVGYTFGLLLGLFLTYRTGLQLWPTIFCALTGASVLIGLTLLYKKITGREDLVYYQHELAILGCCLILLLIINQPVLKYLDITLTGIGVFLAFGRIGCFSVGCCHGKPHQHGVIYSKAHVEVGFPKHYLGVPIFPIQLVESAIVTMIVIVGAYLIDSRSAPGTTLLVYSIIYGLIRFVLEFFRGDAERPYWLGFSEAQWTTLGIFLLSLLLSYYELLPYYLWHVWIVIGLFLFMMGTTIFRNWKKASPHRILRPKHVSEIAEGIELLDLQTPQQEKILIVYTSLGLKISKGTMKADNKIIVHYTISIDENLTKKAKITLNQNTIKVIGRLLQLIKHPNEEIEIVEDRLKVFHIIFRKNNLGIAIQFQ